MKKILLLSFILTTLSCNALKTLTGGETDIDPEFYAGAETLFDDLLFFWNFNSYNSGYQSLSSNNKLTPFGSLANPTVTNGKIGSALDCSTTNASDYLSVSSPDIEDLGTWEDFTVSFWANRSSQLGTNAYIFFFDTGSVDFTFYQTAATADLRFDISGVNYVQTFFTDGQWDHYAIRVSRTDGFSICVNGGCSGFEGTNTDVYDLAPGYVLYICKDNAASTGFDGRIDSFGMWGRVLEEAEIQRLYNGKNLLD